ncbi:InlB B-repeat-containing protein, partial [Parafannyhessea umbonata]
GTGIAYTDAQSVLNLSSTDGDQIELFAIWDEINNFIVHYIDSADMVTTVSVDKTDATWSTTDLYPATDPTKTGYVFDKWMYVDATGALIAVTPGTTAYSTLSDAVDPNVVQAEVTLYAAWLKLVDYKVTYWTTDDNGATLVYGGFTGHGTDVEGTVITPSTMADATHNWSNVSHIPGYVFDVPATTNYGIDSITLDPTLTDQELKLVFVRRSDYILIYDPNYVDNGVPATTDIQNAFWAQDGLDAHSASRRGYTLIGWNTAADGSGKNVVATDKYGQLVLLVDPTASDTDVTTLTLYGLWQEKSDFKVVYDNNYISVGAKYRPASTVTAADREHVAWTAGDLEPVDASVIVAPKGYHLGGWTYIADGNVFDIDSTDQYNTISDTLSPAAALDQITLYAKWIENEIELKYVTGEIDTTTGAFSANASAGTVSRSSETITVVSGTALGAIAAPNPGWHFVKWIRLDASLLTSALMTASTTGFNDLPTDMTQLAFASIQNVTDGLWYGETYMALFEKNDPATLIYDKNASDATGTIADVVEPFGTILTLDSGKNDIETPSDLTDGFKRDHYTLLGWNTKADLSGTHYDLSFDGFELPEGTTVLYAEWEINKGRLIYDKNAQDATGTIADVVKPYGTHITLDSGTEDTTVTIEDGFRRPHYKLVGWNTEPDYSGIHYDLSQGWTMPDGTTVLYAEWEKLTFEIEVSKPTEGGTIIGGDPEPIPYGEPIPEGWVTVIPDSGKHISGWTYVILDEDGVIHTGTIDDPTKLIVTGKVTLTPIFEDDVVESEGDVIEPTPASAKNIGPNVAGKGERIPQTGDLFDGSLAIVLIGAAVTLILPAIVLRRRNDDREEA